MTRVVATSAVLALAGTSYGFVVNQFQIQPNESLAPSVGTFWNYSFGEFSISGLNAVTGYRANWRSYDAIIRTSTWLAIDRLGGGGDFSLALPGLGDDPIVPEWNGYNVGEYGGGAHHLNAGDQYLIQIDGGPEGYIWGFDSYDPPFEAPSAVSSVNGVSKDSIFFGQFVLTDPNATLVGAPLRVIIDGADHLLPLDGAPDADGYRIEYEPFDATYAPYPPHFGLRAFVVIPAPATLAPLALAPLATQRRRRAGLPRDTP